jgi:hypothetical protein
MAELVLSRMPRTQGIELFVRDGINEKDQFPQVSINTSKLSPIDLLTNERFEITVFKTFVISRSTVGAALRDRPSVGNTRH